MAKKQPALGSPAYYDREIDYLLKHRPGGWEKRVVSLMQARNYNARLYSLPERAWPRAVDQRPVGLKSGTKKTAKVNAPQYRLIAGRLVKV